jgi:hypothetical protein
MTKTAVAAPDPDDDRPGKEISLADDGDVRLNPTTADKAQLCIRAAEMRASHKTFAEIARQLHLASPAVAKRAVQRGLGMIPSEDVREMRRLFDQRMDRYSLGLLEVVENPGPLVSQGKIITGEDGEPYPDQMVRVRAYEALLKTLAEQKRMHGADAPRRSVTITSDMITARIAELKAELGISGSAAALGMLQGEAEAG